MQAHSKAMDPTESIPEMEERVLLELVDRIGDGPYFCGLTQPSMLDLAVFPNLVFPYLFGVEDQLPAARYPALKGWLARMAEHLPANPTLLERMANWYGEQPRKLATGPA